MVKTSIDKPAPGLGMARRCQSVVGCCQHAGAGMVFRINSTGTPVTEPLFI